MQLSHSGGFSCASAEFQKLKAGPHWVITFFFVLLSHVRLFCDWVWDMQRVHSWIANWESVNCSHGTNKMYIRDSVCVCFLDLYNSWLFHFRAPHPFLFFLLSFVPYLATRIVLVQPFLSFFSPFPLSTFLPAILDWLKSLLWGESKGTVLQAWVLSGCVWLSFSPLWGVCRAQLAAQNSSISWRVVGRYKKWRTGIGFQRAHFYI